MDCFIYTYTLNLEGSAFAILLYEFEIKFSTTKMLCYSVICNNSE